MTLNRKVIRKWINRLKMYRLKCLLKKRERRRDKKEREDKKSIGWKLYHYTRKQKHVEIFPVCVSFRDENSQITGPL